MGKYFFLGRKGNQMGRRKTGLDERILKAADGLFYRKGYTNTGISQVVAEAGTNKPGLYSYFEGKDDLARRYLQIRNDDMVGQIIEIGNASSDVFDFFRRWMDHARDHALGRFGDYNGCAVANFALQTDAEDVPMQGHIRTVGRRWQSRLVAYIRNEIKAGKFSVPTRRTASGSKAMPGAAAIARRMLVCNEGAITMWKLTGQTAHFDEAIVMFEASLGRVPDD